VRAVTELRPECADLLTEWLFLIAGFKPYVFPWHRAASHGGMIALSDLGRDLIPLEERWSFDGTPVPSPKKVAAIAGTAARLPHAAAALAHK
jgi:hypothetical protein